MRYSTSSNNAFGLLTRSTNEGLTSFQLIEQKLIVWTEKTKTLCVKIKVISPKTFSKLNEIPLTLTQRVQSFSEPNFFKVTIFEISLFKLNFEYLGFHYPGFYYYDCR